MLVIRQQPRAAGFTERDQLASESRRTYDDQSINDASRVENQHSKRADGKERAKRLLNHDAEFASTITSSAASSTFVKRMQHCVSELITTALVAKSETARDSKQRDQQWNSKQRGLYDLPMP